MSDNASAVLIEVKSDITASSVEEMKEAWMGKLGNSPAEVLLDLSGVEYIDSSGISLVLGLKQECEEVNKGKLFIKGANESVKKIFCMVKLDEYLGL